MSAQGALMAQTASALSVVPLLRSMMVPSDHQTDIAPDAGVSGVNAFINSIKCTFTYDVAATPPIYTEGVGPIVRSSDCVPFINGLYLSLPQESHESLWHMGFVPAGAEYTMATVLYQSYPASVIQRGFDIRNHYCGPPQALVFSAGTNCPGFKLSYIGELALPRVGANQGITFATSVASNYSKVRAFAADFKISSTTISGTNFNMAGTLHSGIIADTRNISQVVTDQSSVRQAYPAALLNAQSITRPDDMSGVEVMKGAIDIMGPDYPRQWCSVDVDATDSIQGQWQTFQYVLPTGYSAPAVSGTTAAAQGSSNVAQFWITPTDTEFFITNHSNPSGAPQNWQKFYTGAINEDGILDIDIGLRANVAATGGAPSLSPCTYHYTANFIHIFAYVAPTGYVQYNLASETQRVPITTHMAYNQLAIGNNGGAAPPSLQITTQIPSTPATIVRSRPRMMRSGMAVSTGGKYLGTCVTLSLEFAGQYTDTQIYGVYAFGSTIRTRARNVDAPGRVGPAHIIRYDGLGVGQQMSFAGTTWLQGIALGQLAPFINTNGVTLTVPDNIFSKFVELLWAMSPKYRRILSLAEYNQYVKPYFRDLTLGDLLQSIEKLDSQSSAIAKSLGAAGGWFPQLGEFYDRNRGKIAAAAALGTLGGLGAAYAGRGGPVRRSLADEYEGYEEIGGGGLAGGQYHVTQEGNNARYINLYNPGSANASGSYRRRYRDE